MTISFAAELCSGASAAHSRNKFDVQVYLEPSRLSSLGARMATVRVLLNCFRSWASFVSLRPIFV